jgi:hypothetical protein
MKFSDSRRAVSLLAFAAVFMAACSDSTGPTSLDSNSALQSLAIWLSQDGEADAPTAAQTKSMLDAITPLLHKVSVTFDGASQDMYGFAIRQTFPAGTCQEDIFVDPQFPPVAGVCTPAFAGVETILWQARSSSKPPDKLIVTISDVGTNDFDLSTVAFDDNGNPVAGQPFPALALYVAGQDRIFSSESGTITTSMTSTGPSCSVPTVPYAKSATCNVVSFVEAGTIVMTELALDGSAGKALSLGIPSINMDGLWIDITEVQPITVGANRSLARVLPFRGLLNKLKLNGYPLPAQR